ncbi:hypothetical protein E4U53_006908 [Claviceps sorghi]|nr:hypothetical protein E4U53_006908 [Claviceps sorghi]
MQQLLHHTTPRDTLVTLVVKWPGGAKQHDSYINPNPIQKPSTSNTSNSASLMAPSENPHPFRVKRHVWHHNGQGLPHCFRVVLDAVHLCKNVPGQVRFG